MHRLLGQLLVLPLLLSLGVLGVLAQPELHNALISSVRAGTVDELRTILRTPDAPRVARDMKLVDGGTLLHLAVTSGSELELLQVLIDAGLDLEARDSLNRTPLQLAVSQHPSEQAAMILLAAGADPLVTDSMLTSPFGVAVRSQRNQTAFALAGALIEKAADAGVTREAAQWLAEQAALDLQELERSHEQELAALSAQERGHEYQTRLDGYAAQYGYGRLLSDDWRTALRRAVTDGTADDFVAAMYYAARAFDTDLEMGGNRTLTQLVAAEGQDPDILNILAAEGADLEGPTSRGHTLLLLAIEQNPVDAIAFRLIELGADLHTQSEVRSAPLEAAIATRRIPIVLAITDTLEAAQLLPTQVAEARVWLWHREIEQRVRQEPDYLLELAASFGTQDLIVALEASGTVNHRDGTGRTPLMEAARNNSNEVVQLLLEYGAEVNTPADDGFTALMHAAQASRDAAVLETLLDAGANPVMRNCNGAVAADFATNNPNMAASPVLTWLVEFTQSARTVMHAADSGGIEHLRVALEAGDDVHMVDEHGRNPLMRALLNNANINAIELLISLGSDVQHTDHDGRTVHDYAAHSGHPDKLRIVNGAVEERRRIAEQARLRAEANRHSVAGQWIATVHLHGGGPLILRFTVHDEFIEHELNQVFGDFYALTNYGWIYAGTLRGTRERTQGTLRLLFSDGNYSSLSTQFELQGTALLLWYENLHGGINYISARRQ